ncbi:hypothetical protein L1887_52345 [Cichorium endivia]|nr:hypothetical protein L1887_52345 [Cichorium endivia]
MSDSLVRVSRRAEWGATGRCREHAGISAETARAANHDRRDGISTSLSTARRFGRRTNPHRSTPRVDRRTGYRRSTSDRDASPAPIRFPPDNFKHSLTLFFKVLFIFPSRYLFAIGLTPVFSLGRNLPPYWGLHSQTNPTRRQRLVVRQGPGTTGLSPSLAPPSRGLGPGPPLRTLLQDYYSDSEAVRFSSWADPGSLAVTKGILVHVHGSFCFAGFDNEPSAGSPTETLLRLLLPLNDKVQ